MQNIDEISKQRAIKLFDSSDLLHCTITDKISDRAVFIKGIEQSYYYEEPDDYEG